MKYALSSSGSHEVKDLGDAVACQSKFDSPGSVTNSDGSMTIF